MLVYILMVIMGFYGVLILGCFGIIVAAKIRYKLKHLFD